MNPEFWTFKKGREGLAPRKGLFPLVGAKRNEKNGNLSGLGKRGQQRNFQGG